MFASALLALPKSVIKLPKTILQYAIRAAKVLPPGLIYLSSSSILYYCAIVLCVIFLSLFWSYPAWVLDCTLHFPDCAFRKTGARTEPEQPSIEECFTALYVCFPDSYQEPYGQLCMWRKCSVMCFNVGCMRSRATFQGRLVFVLVNVEAVFFSNVKHIYIA